MEKFLQELNESQRKAVLYNEGPSLIIAGAGSGKTRVLTYKIAYLLEQGLPPYSVLALTFTNKAAKEMKERIARVVGDSTARQLWMGTFHSIFSRILRTNATLLGFKSDFTIYDSADSKNLIKTIIKEMQLDDKTYRPGSVQSQISNAKNHLITPGMYTSNKDLQKYDSQSGRPLLGEIYTRYWNRCKNAGAMDFDDLLLYTNILFRDHPDVLEKYQDFFRFILVDEYQDTNKAQHLIVELLSKKHNRVCVVGDDAQSIYSFRGANIANILNFRSSIPGTRIFKLEQNYRSTQTIVKAANSLIRKNKEQIEKNVFSEKQEGAPIPLFSSFSDFEEAYLVANKISEMRMAGSYKFADFAVLYRTNAQTRVLEEAFRKRGIPYRIYGGLSFYQRKEVKDVIAYLRLTTNPNDEEAFKRVINYPKRGIGDTTVAKIGLAAAQADISLFEVLRNPIGYLLDVKAGAASKLSGFRELIEGFQEAARTKNAFEMAELIVRASGITTELCQDSSVEGLTRQQNVQELLNGVHEFVSARQEEGNDSITLTDYLGEISLATDQDTDKGDADKITLMTIHASKGLEFKNVFVVGLEEDLFPSMMAKESPGGLEEERRLFYVALTRAEENCILSYAGMRFRNGQQQPCSPSRFLRDIDPVYLQMPAGNRLGDDVHQQARRFSENNQVKKSVSNGTSGVRKDLASQQVGQPKANEPVSLSGKRLKSLGSSSASSPGSSFGSGVQVSVKEGNVIRHDRFGIGTIIRLEGSGDNAKATVEFENVGTKQLLLKFAKFDILQ
ncbi:MAG: ATP-dependent helicase [Bacteroidales bacterium]